MADYTIIGGNGKKDRIGLHIERENLDVGVGINNWTVVENREGKESIEFTDMRYGMIGEVETADEGVISPEDNTIYIHSGVTIEIPEDVMDEFVNEIKDKPALRNNY